MNLQSSIELRKRSGEGSIAFIGNYLPRQCGIATFTTDLCDAVGEEAAGADCIAVAMNDVPEGYAYPDRVRFEVAQNSLNEYRNTADFLNVNQVQSTCVQHEYGIFGGRAGSHLLALLRELRMPIVTTLHTVLRDPNDDQRRVLEELAQLSDRLVVMSQRAVEFLAEVHKVPESRALAYAIGAGKAVISTPYWYASELLAEGRGTIVPFRDSEALASSVIDWLDREAERHATRKRAYLYGRRMTWKEVARRYLEVFEEVHRERQYLRRPLPLDRLGHRDRDEVPELDLRHLRRLTDDTGLLQHAAYSVPMRGHGYCTDDVARGLIVAVKGREWLQEQPETLDGLLSVYLSFLEHAFDPTARRFRNFMSYERQWVDDVPSEDAHGRALWGLGVAAGLLDEPGRRSLSARLFKGGLSTVLDFDGLRSHAFALLGLDTYLRHFGGDSEARRVRERLADRLYDAFAQEARDGWRWPEEQVTYDNGRLPHALLATGRALGRDEMVEMGLEALDFLMDNQRAPEGHFSPIGQDGWLASDGQRARFDQQPIETEAMIEAWLAAWDVTGDERCYREAHLCFDWFLGRNDLQVPLFDSATGGCCDALTSVGRNQNEGAESTLAWLMSVVAMQEARVRHTIQTPPSGGPAVSVTPDAHADPVR
jgi:hypothetical protein